MSDTIERSTPSMDSEGPSLSQVMGRFTHVGVNNGSGENNDSTFGAEKGSGYRRPVCAVDHANEEQLAFMKEMRALMDQQTARCDANNALAAAHSIYVKATCAALQDDITALQFNLIAETKTLNGSDHDDKIAIPAFAPKALPTVLDAPAEPISPTSIIDEPTSATKNLQSIEPKFETVASILFSSPEPESPKLVVVESGSTKLKIGTAHGESEKGEQVKLPNVENEHVASSQMGEHNSDAPGMAKFVNALDGKPGTGVPRDLSRLKLGFNALVDNVLDAILRTSEPCVNKQDPPSSKAALMANPPPYEDTHVADFKMGEYDDPPSKLQPTALTVYNSCDNERRKRFSLTCKILAFKFTEVNKQRFNNSCAAFEEEALAQVDGQRITNLHVLSSTFHERSVRNVPHEAQIAQEELNFSFVFNDIGGIYHHHAGVGSKDFGELYHHDHRRFDDDKDDPGHDGDPYAVDEGQWNQGEEFHDGVPYAIDKGQWNQGEDFYDNDQEEDFENYDIDEHDDGHDDGRDFDDDD